MLFLIHIFEKHHVLAIIHGRIILFLKLHSDFNISSINKISSSEVNISQLMWKGDFPEAFLNLEMDTPNFLESYVHFKKFSMK